MALSGGDFALTLLHGKTLEAPVLDDPEMQAAGEPVDEDVGTTSYAAAAQKVADEPIQPRFVLDDGKLTRNEKIVLGVGIGVGVTAIVLGCIFGGGKQPTGNSHGGGGGPM